MAVDVQSLLDQLETHHAVVGGSMRGNRAFAFVWRQRIEAVDTFRVEDFIDTERELAFIHRNILCKLDHTYNGESSLGRSAESRKISVVFAFGYL